MSTRRRRSRSRTPILTGGSAPRPRIVVDFQKLRRDRTLELCDLTAAESDRRHLEEARPLLELAVAADRIMQPDNLVEMDIDAGLRAAVRIAGPCPAGWCRYPNGHTGDHEPLEAA